MWEEGKDTDTRQTDISFCVPLHRGETTPISAQFWQVPQPSLSSVLMALQGMV